MRLKLVCPTICCCTFVTVLVSMIPMAMVPTQFKPNIEAGLFQRMSVADKLQLDWSKPFVSDIYTVNSNESCQGADEPIINMPWFGANHLCVDSEFNMVRGISCGEAGLLYAQYQVPYEGTRRVRTTFNDFVGFPMV